MGLSIPIHSLIRHPGGGCYYQFHAMGLTMERHKCPCFCQLLTEHAPSYVKDYQSPFTVFGAIDNEHHRKLLNQELVHF